MAISAQPINFDPSDDNSGVLSLDLLQGVVEDSDPPQDLDVDDSNIVVESSNAEREVEFGIDGETGVLTLDTSQLSDLGSDDSGETISITYTITGDGESEDFQNTATLEIQGTDQPPVVNFPETLEVDEDETLEFTGDNALSIDDPEGNLESAALSVRDGVLNIEASDSLTIEGNSTDELELSGSQADINTALGTLSYSPNPDFKGSDRLTVIADDATFNFGVSAESITVNSVNDDPTLAIPLTEQLEEGDDIATEDEAFSLSFDAGTFVDLLDPEDSLTYSAMVEGAEEGEYEPLPEEGWLEFDPETITFSGTPENDDVGEYDLKVIATDDGEGELTAEDTFSLTVENTNDAPTVTNTFHDQFIADPPELEVEGADLNGFEVEVNGVDENEYTHFFNLREERSFSITLPEDAFDDVDVDDELTYSATLANGDELPESFSFDPETLTLSGFPDDDAVREGSFEIKITATDLAGEEASENIVLDIENFNDAPELDLNGLDEPSKNFVAEGVTPTSDLISVVDRDLSLIDVDNDYLSAATVQITNPSNGFSESLSVDTRGTSIQKTYDPNRGILYLIGEDTVENYEDVLRTVQYSNSFNSGINQELIIEFGVWDFPGLDYPNFEYPYFGFLEDSISEIPFDPSEEQIIPAFFDPEDPEMDLESEFQVASAISYTQFETDSTIIGDGGEGDYLFIGDTDGGDTDDEFDISLDADNNTLVVDTNSDFSISEGYGYYDFGDYLLDEEFSDGVSRIGLGQSFYGYGPSVQAINGLAEIDFDSIYEVTIDTADGEDVISVDVSDLDLMGGDYMDGYLSVDIINGGFFGPKLKMAEFEGEESEEMPSEPMPSDELELKGALASGMPFESLVHEFYMDYGVEIDATGYEDIDDDMDYDYPEHVSIDYEVNSMTTVVDELDVDHRVYEFEAYEDEAGVEVTIADNEMEADGKSMISSNMSSESIIFNNPNSSLTVDTGSYEATDDMVSVNGLDSEFAAEFIIDTGAGEDTIVGSAGDETIIGGADKDLLTGGAGGDTFVLNSLLDSTSAGGNFDKILDLEVGVDTIAAPFAVALENVNNYGEPAKFNVPTVQALLGEEFGPNEAAIVEFRTREFLIINDGIAEFDNTQDALIEITGYTGDLDNLAIAQYNPMDMSDMPDFG
ncbi:MAG: putative Ig domain-containing protein [Cyanobacteria bacterium J06623_7]